MFCILIVGVTKVYIVDDHQMLIDGLKALLNGESHISVIGQNTLPKIAAKEIINLNPDIVLTDINMPEMDGIELTKEIKKHNPNIKVIALSMFGERETISEMLRAGVSAYILKNTGKQELLNAIDKVSNGGTFFSDEVSDVMSKPSTGSFTKEIMLSLREIEVVELIAKEYTNAQIAEALFISERTVETHRKNIFRKTDTKGVIGLLKYCVEKKIIKPLK
ncbi:MAG TPA: response regulator transcription factor [Bacteroidia bacterium]|nr:response regulator transcription factor [Bacteroidia bacterium]